MKNLFFGLVAFAALSLSSCKDECKDVECANGGTCEEGICSCPAGYEGDLCETLANAKFVGSFKYNESCGGSTVTDFPCSFSASSSSPSGIVITGFAGFGCNGASFIVNGTVVGSDITIPQQSLCSGQVTIESGSGTLNASGNSISMTYTYSFGGASETCSGTYTKL